MPSGPSPAIAAPPAALASAALPRYKKPMGMNSSIGFSGARDGNAGEGTVRRWLRDRARSEVPAILRKLLATMRGHPWLLPIALVLNVLSYFFESVGISLLVPILLSLASASASISDVIAQQEGFLKFIFGIADHFAGPHQKVILVGLIVFCIFLRSATGFASAAAFAYVSGKIGHSLRARAFDAIVRANHGYIDSRPPGMLLNALGSQTWRIAGGVRLIAMMVTSGCAVLVFLTVMLLISWKVTLIVAVGVAAIMAVVQLITSGARRIGDQTVLDNTALAARMTEGLGGLSTIRLFGQEEQEGDRFNAASERVRRSFLRLDLINALPSSVLNLLFAAFLGLLILLFGTEGFLDLALCLALLQRMRPHAVALVEARIGLLNLGGALDMVSDLIEGTEATPLADGDRPAPAPSRGIRFAGVRHRYPTAESDAVAGLDCMIRAGATTALVGPSGAGKSTIANLVCRQFDPTEGEILIDDVALPALALASWRDRIAVVPQDIYLFNTTLRENIAYGHPEATETEIVDAARMAGALDFIAALPEGLDTVVGDRGSRFSGGQRQRIALARALVRNPDVLILDEATNALDNFAAALVRDAIERASVGRTVLVIAHRMAGVMAADDVIVLDRGHLVEQGAPHELLARGGTFAQMVAAEHIAA
jgi:ABC-type multidrug transport system fused ATPase/permease subunit